MNDDEFRQHCPGLDGDSGVWYSWMHNGISNEFLWLELKRKDFALLQREVVLPKMS